MRRDIIKTKGWLSSCYIKSKQQVNCRINNIATTISFGASFGCCLVCMYSSFFQQPPTIYVVYGEFVYLNRLDSSSEPLSIREIFLSGKPSQTNLDTHRQKLSNKNDKNKKGGH